METDRGLTSIMGSFGPPVFLREAKYDGRFAAAIGRWQHTGAEVDFDNRHTVRLIFNLTGGQTVLWRSLELNMDYRPQVGSIALACPTPSATVSIKGRADTVQIILSRALFGAPDAPLHNQVFYRIDVRQRLQALALQGLVGSGLETQGFSAEISRIAQEAALMILALNVDTPKRHLGGLSANSLRRVKSVVTDRQSGSTTAMPTVGEMADAAGLSPFHFIRSFRTTEGITPHAWLIALRLDTALRRLLDSNERLGDVAEASGFNSLPYFIDVFRKRFGVTPGKIRAAVAN